MYRPTKKHHIEWIAYFNDANNEKWDYYWFDKNNDEAFLDLLDSKKHLIRKIFEFPLSR